jgi:hypothetical protein
VARHLTDTDRARIALGWAESGLPQDEYAAQFGLTSRAIRKWRSRLVAERKPIEQVEAVLVETIAVLQTLFASVRAQHGSAPEHPERDGRLDAAAARPVVRSASFHPEPLAVGMADPQHFVSHIVDATRAGTGSAPPMPPDAHDCPEQHPVDVVGPHVLADVPSGQGQPEPVNAAPLPMPRPSGGFLMPF